MLKSKIKPPQSSELGETVKKKEKKKSPFGFKKHISRTRHHANSRSQARVSLASAQTI